MIPTAENCGFLAATKPFLLPYPQGTLPIGPIGGKRAVTFQGSDYFLTVTREGWFALFPLDATTATPASFVILRKDGIDTNFDCEESLSRYLKSPLPVPVEYVWDESFEAYMIKSGQLLYE